MVPQFIPDPYGLWKAVVWVGPQRRQSYPVIGWAVFKGFSVEPMVFDPVVGRNLTVNDLANHNSVGTTEVRVTVTLERV